jgi:cation/acetate symporter
VNAAVGSVGLNVAIFAVFVAVTLAVVYRVSHTNPTVSEFYAAGRALTGLQNGVAIAGDYLSAASFLGIAGAIAVNGYDGFLFSIGFLVAWLLALLLVAELTRNTGRYTVGDVLAYRMHERPVRAAAATSTLVVSCSTCSRRWPGPAVWSRCCCRSRRRTGRARRSSSPSLVR